MKRFRLVVSGLIAIFVLVVMGLSVAHAQSFRTGSNISTGANEKINQTLYIAGSNVDVASEVYGDVFCAGQTVNVSGTIHGDVICAGQSITVTGKVYGNVRLAGQTITLGADVSGNASIAGQTFTLLSQAKVGGDIGIGSSTATVNGSIGRDLAFGGQDLTIGSTIGRNVKAGANNITLVSGATINGNLDYTSQNDVTLQSGAKVDGQTTKSTPAAKPSKTGSLLAFSLGWAIYCLAALIFLTFLLALAFPKRLYDVTTSSVPWPWRALVTGFLAGIVVPIVLVILAITVIGIPAAIIVGLAWLVILLLSAPVSAFYVGRVTMRNNRHALVIGLVGSLILGVLLVVPILSFFVFLATVWIGSGIILHGMYRLTPQPKYIMSSDTPMDTKATKSKKGKE